MPSPATMVDVTGNQGLNYAHLPDSRAHICAYAVAVDWTPQKIKNRRTAKGWDQNRLATELGVSRRAITNWETGQADPQGKNLRRLDAVLGDAPQPDVSLQGASDAEFIAEMARRLAQRDSAPQLPTEDLWWPRAHPQDVEPLGDRNTPGAQQG